ncbi:Uracil-regulated protein 1 [Coemansia spiralis]|uniref:Uracil-regulated protein 1 n=2 Tax=Coemansia TaxID=4863 RepID=A0A9W8KYM3_9FUNG|nr:GTP cyclohydrolase N terminal-domain-containing protein [Coemansia spiralis]KAJ1995268.1 Uracil-regulated protein 1 [Coemansia umbellata]KAJ2625670.1 Uracil-regulated protein 1 [Coemansia sp. RSA 1358]KAJ2678490.1 Uracil-regulated protein 1 [Coemansia spiralis]
MTAGTVSPLSADPGNEPVQDQLQQVQSLYPSRVVLTTYPSQHGINPIPLKWGAKDPAERGPVVVSRNQETLGKRNAMGAGGGSYCIYRALAVAIGALTPNHRPDFRLTEPTNKFGPFDAWCDPEKIVSMDPWGHAVVEHFDKYVEEGTDVRPTIAITKAHIKLAEIDDAISKGILSCDGDIITKNGELKVVKVAAEPVWYLPGVAKRFGISEAVLRRALFEDTGGMYPELITRPDLQVFLPPIGGLTVYIFGDPAFIPDPTKRLTMRVHDECNGSDVFGSDICTCKPYLIYSIEECAREAQNGGVGVVVYFRKEGRALGEVTKYLVYNARKRQEGGDTAANYFKRTEFVAGVKDMRFQALMPDILHWLGVKRIDRFISMSNMKYEAIVGSGIEIVERVSIPEERMPADSKVEIEAKIADGYFTTGEVPTAETLQSVKGRNWDEIAH